jgi:hypothetical protein
MTPKHDVRSESEITETEGSVSYGRIILWTLAGIGVVIGVVSYFKYARLLPPLLG